MTAIGIVVIILSALAGAYCYSRWMETDGSDKWLVMKDIFVFLMTVGICLVCVGLVIQVWRALP